MPGTSSANLAFQVCNFLWRKLKHKVIRESFEVAFNGTIQRAGVNAVKFCQMIVEHHLLTANQEDEILDSFQWNQFNALIHIHLIISLRSQIVTSSFIF